MIPSRTYGKKAPLAALGLLLSLTVLSGCHKAVAPGAGPKSALTAATGKTNTTAMADANLSLEFVSVFDDRLPRVNTRDPFYPDSTREVSVNPAVTTQSQAPKEAVLKLYSIAGSSKRRLAVINNEILAVGEESDIKTGDHKVHVKVIEIGEDYVVVAVQGESGPKRLTLTNK